MNIGIYGGAFNPIHNAHLILAQSAMEEYKLDKVLFLVSANPPHKIKDNLISFEDRYEMCKLATDCEERFVVSDIEKDFQGKTYTYNVMLKLFEVYGKENNYFLILGEDEANYFDSWYRYEDILKLVKVVFGKRPTSLPKNNLNFDYVTMPIVDFSSSEIREKIRQNKSIYYYTPEKVVEYIKERKLYL